MIQTSARLLALLSLLQVRREWTGQELADRLDVGPRTIRRDVEKLRTLGYPVHAARGVAGGYRLGSGGRLPPLLLDEAEAVAVAVGLRSAAAASIGGVNETAVRALVKLEQVLPERLRRRVQAIGATTSAIAMDSQQIDPDVLATLASACRDNQQARFGYVSKDETPSQRWAEPCALVHSGFNWYLVAYDLDREDWRTFRVDRIGRGVKLGGKGGRRTVPGGNAAAYVKASKRAASGAPDLSDEPGRIRMQVAASALKGKMPSSYASFEPEREDACVITSRDPWSVSFLVWAAMLGYPMEVLGPPELVEAAKALVERLSPAVMVA